MEENTPQQSYSQAKKGLILSKLIIVVFLLLLLLLTGGAGYYLGQNQQKIQNGSAVDLANRNQEEEEENSPTPVQIGSTEWRTSKDLGPFSFEYPNGWHVTSRWPDGNFADQGVSVWMDTEPISGAPRGGPFAKIEMSWRNGNKDAKEIFENIKSTIKADYENVKEEIIESEIGNIYHYTAVFPEGYLGGAELDEYIMMIDVSDDINDTVITLIAIDKPELKDTLRHIALSIKKHN